MELAISVKGSAFPTIQVFYYRLERNSRKILLIRRPCTLIGCCLLIDALIGAGVHTEVNFTEEFA